MRAVLPWLAAFAFPQAASSDQSGSDPVLEEVVVYGVTPGEGARRRHDQIARHVQSVSAATLREARSFDLTEFLEARMASVSLNAVQGNPLQPDLLFRGYTASPLLGLPQGLAVYQDGARLNGPLGDAVHWDLVARSAVHRLSLVGGADPLYGLNSLGGALSMQMKNGFLFQGHRGEIAAGSHRRTTWTAESGGNDGSLGYYANLSRFDEDGWRDLSPSRATNGYLALGWRNGRTELDLGLQAADTELTGNGPSPVGLLARDRAAIFTAPDVTANDLTMVTVSGRHAVSDRVRAFGSAFDRRLRTRSLNGDASEYTVCRLGGAERLLEGLEQDLLEDAGTTLAAACSGAYPDASALEAFLASAASAGDVHLEDVTPALSGSGILSDEAILNRSRRRQVGRGFDLGLEAVGHAFGVAHELVLGARRYDGRARFRAEVELAQLDPATRNAAGLGVGSLVDDEATAVSTRTDSWSVYVLDTISFGGLGGGLGDAIALSLSARYDRTDVTIRDDSGRQPEVEGDHRFQRVNPAVGVTWQPSRHVNVFAGWSQASRAPTPIELTCNEAVFDAARQRAIADGADPDDADFECRLPNAFVADPPLDQVVADSLEAGARGTAGAVVWHVGLFRQVNRNDIVFQTTGRATGLFGSIGRTRRTGLELVLRGEWQDLDWFFAYTGLRAEFGDDFTASSPSHPAADASGRIQVRDGDRLPGVPEHQLKLGLGWHPGDSLGVGIDFRHYSGSHLRGDEVNLLPKTGAYSIIDLRASQRLTRRLRAFVRISNLLDEKYESHGLIAEDPGAVLPDLADPRPLFLSPGAPRAAWLGLELTL